VAMLLSEEQRMLADTAGHFLADRTGTAGLRAVREAARSEGYDLTTWKACAEMGFACLLVPEAFGGLGLGQVEAGLVQEALGRNLIHSPFLSTAVGAAVALGHAGESLRKRWLPRIASGEAVIALAIDESLRHRPEQVACMAVPSGPGPNNSSHAITGHKRAVVQAGAADALMVLARTAGGDRDPAGTTLFLIERDAPGLAFRPERLLDAGQAATVNLENVEAGAHQVIGEAGQASAVLEPMLAALRTGAAAELVGLGLGAFAMTLDYLKQRKQFGRTIGSFQALQHRAAQLDGELQLASAAVLKAQQLLDAGDADGPAAAMVAKAVAGEASLLAVQEGVQMHGGIGMTDEHDIGLFMKRQRVLGELWGNADTLADQLARDQGY
jgi:alkylation response protein AidB-like acyl-CoA dehydrogenase